MRLFLADVVKSWKLQGKMEFQGLPIAVENKKGSVRKWHDPHNGTDGETKMQHPYGYVEGTLGMDGDEVDVYVGPNDTSTKVFVITQNKAPKFTEVDEQKVMLGFNSGEEAKAAYLKHYDNPKFFHSMKELSLDEFVQKLSTHKGKLIKHLYLASSSAKLDKAVDHAKDIAMDDVEKAHVGFDKLKQKVQAEGHSAESAGKIAAAVGNKKYGEKKMHHAAEEGKPLKESQKLDKSCEHNPDGVTCEKCNGTHSTKDLLKALTSVVFAMGARDRARLEAQQAAQQRRNAPEPEMDMGEFAPRQVNVNRPFEPVRPPTAHVATPAQAASPLSPDFMTTCDGCGYMHKSISTCPRCEQISKSNKEAVPFWRR